MQVIGAGFGRTGTMSLKVALEELGAGPCLHSLEWLTSDRPAEDLAIAAGGPSHWQRLADGERIDWHEALAGWGSVLDWVGARFYTEMLDAWPEAKVILSVRDSEEWYESCHASLHATREMTASAGRASSPAVLEAMDSAIWQDLFDGRFLERAHAIEVFERHREQVIERVPAEQLLIYDISDGWQPLCELLGAPVPATPFPHLNSRNSFWTRFGARDGAGAVETSHSDADHVASPRNGAGQAATPRNGTGQAATPRNGTGQAATPRNGTGQAAAAAGRSAVATPTVTPRIAGLALAEPARSFTQEEMLAALGLADDEFAQRIFSRCGVQRREVYLDPELLRTPMQGRTAAVEDQLLARAKQAIDGLGVDPGEIGTVISATLFSLGCPTLAHRLIETCGMDAATDKYHVVGVGCASAVPLVRLAAQTLAADPAKKTLIVAAESMSGMLSSATGEDPKSKTVGSAIFGDGCAAMLLDGSGEAQGPAVLASRVHQIPATLGAVTMEYAPSDSYLGLIRELPDVAGAHLRGLVDGFLAENGLTGHMVDHWLIHPGGRRIIESAQEALDLPDEDVAVSVEVLANQGNVGTPSIFYVIAKAIERRDPQPGELGLAITIGPGVTVGLMLLRW